MARVLLAIIAFYRRVLSPLKGRPTCRFLPTCSEYAEDALRTHGAWRGTRLTVWRLLRCHPFCAGGHDPVPLAPGPERLSASLLPRKKLHGRHR